MNSQLNIAHSAIDLKHRRQSCLLLRRFLGRLDDGIIIADIDPGLVAETRARIASLTNDRPCTIERLAEAAEQGGLP